MADETPAFEVLGQASKSLEQAAASLAALPVPLAAAAQAQAQAAAAQQAAAQPAPIPLAPGYVYQPTPTPLQLAQRQAQQQGPYPAGGIPAFPTAAAPPPLQAAQQQAAAAPPSPGTLALAAARATPMPPQQGAPPQAGAFGSAVTSATAGLLIMRAAMNQVVGTLLEFGAKASPTHAATLSGSFDLLSAKIGTFLLPAMQDISQAAQNLARSIPDPRQPQSLLGGASLEQANVFGQRVSGVAALKDLFGSVFGTDPAKLSYKNLPQPTYGSASEYGDRLSRAGLGAGGLEGDQLKIVNENLVRLIGAVERGAGPPGQAGASFR